jgi:hypothetical protein
MAAGLLPLLAVAVPEVCNDCKGFKVLVLALGWYMPAQLLLNPDSPAPQLVAQLCGYTRQVHGMVALEYSAAVASAAGSAGGRKAAGANTCVGCRKAPPAPLQMRCSGSNV